MAVGNNGAGAAGGGGEVEPRRFAAVMEEPESELEPEAQIQAEADAEADAEAEAEGEGSPEGSLEGSVEGECEGEGEAPTSNAALIQAQVQGAGPAISLSQQFEKAAQRARYLMCLDASRLRMIESHMFGFAFC
jgi:hypothetical protein